MPDDKQHAYVKPKYKTTYEPGLVGFSFKPSSPTSVGITVVTGDEAQSNVRVSHAFLVEDEDYCIEAVGDGVTRNPLSHYFSDEYEVYFKRPKGMNPKQAGMVVDAARAHLGQDYSYFGIFGMLMDWLFVKWMVKLDDKFEFFTKRRNPFNSRSTWFCSELVAFSLHCLPEYRDSELLRKWHPTRISPQRLFESDLLDPWSMKTMEEVRARYADLLIA